jgi:site-specific recombinase XerD
MAREENGHRGDALAHARRHACVTHLLRGRADVRHIQELLGHERLETTAVYTRVEIENLKRALAKAHPRHRASRVPGKGRK